MGYNIFLQIFFFIFFQNCLVFIPAKNTINMLVPLRGLVHGNLMECQEEILKNNKSDSDFAPIFVDHHLLLETTFNGQCLINNISIFLSLKK